MEKEEKKGAGKQYLHYFRIWFLLVGILGLTAAFLAARNARYDRQERNSQAPGERVYDLAGVLSSKEEEDLRRRIGEIEQALRIDVVIVIIDQPMEGEQAREETDAASGRLEDVMEAYADNFWDDNYYGYNKGFEGDGLLLADNVHEGQGYWHISTSGKVEKALGEYDIEQLLYALQARYGDDCYRGYVDFLRAVERQIPEAFAALERPPLPWAIVVLLPALAAFLYAATILSLSNAKEDTPSALSIAGEEPLLTNQRDDFLRKDITTRKLEKSSRSGSGGGGGGGGSHRSRSGARHGGGGRRH